MAEREIAEYRAAVQAAVLCAKLLEQHDIPQLLRDIEHADAVGPILNPTLWMQKHGAMNEDREVLRAALALRNIGVKLARAAEVQEAASG